MKPLIRLEKIGDEWAVILRSGRVEFRDACYAKVVGVYDYLESRRRAELAERVAS